MRSVLSLYTALTFLFTFKNKAMATFKKSRVFMLPTKEKAQLHLHQTNLLFVSQIPQNPSHNEYASQHLYITSNDEIKEGDWYINSQNEPYLNRAGSSSFYDLYDYCEKIIATTDSSLEVISKGINPVYEKLPQPSQAFIQKFVEEYNGGRKITEVMVEYEPDLPITCTSEGVRLYPNLKVNPKDNTVTIKKVKESWNREELENKLWEIRTFYHQYENIPFNHIRPLFKEWIKENI